MNIANRWLMSAWYDILCVQTLIILPLFCSIEIISKIYSICAYYGHVAFHHPIPWCELFLIKVMTGKFQN